MKSLLSVLAFSVLQSYHSGISIDQNWTCNESLACGTYARTITTSTYINQCMLLFEIGSMSCQHKPTVYMRITFLGDVRILSVIRT